MDIVTAPWTPAPSRWSRVLAVVGVFAPVTVLALLPIGLGLDRYVVTGDEMAPAIERGSVLIEREVPVSDLRVGDVITYRPPSWTGLPGPITRRIVALEAGRAYTRPDARPEDRARTVVLDHPTQQRVVVVVPYVGYVFMVLTAPGREAVVVTTLIGFVGLALAGALGRVRRRARA
jgi:signal peptidase